ncbi:MAG: hypothetical protein Q7K43_00700, partial [Candidatus Woesearchaeota archaeon]|nr:hypothetical protein [Candidatus Woesearchaeota archaeon]
MSIRKPIEKEVLFNKLYKLMDAISCHGVDKVMSVVSKSYQEVRTHALKNLEKGVYGSNAYLKSIRKCDKLFYEGFDVNGIQNIFSKYRRHDNYTLLEVVRKSSENIFKDISATLHIFNQTPGIKTYFSEIENLLESTKASTTDSKDVDVRMLNILLEVKTAGLDSEELQEQATSWIRDLS